MSSDTISNSIVLARQPIFDNDLNTYAYELLFRSDLSNESGVTEFNGDLATSQVINHTFMEFGIERVLGNKLGFINLTRAFLTGEIPIPFDNKQLVLEILEDIVVDDEIINAVKKLSAQGFTIALDDFIYHEDLKPLIALADIIKIDLLALTEQELIEHVEILKQEKVKLLAEKVETEAQYQLCKQLGFDYYQGYFFCKPTLLDDKPLPDNKVAALRLLNSLQDPDSTIDEIESLISQDISLSFKLLRCLNSAAFALPKKVESLRQGVVYLGLKTIKSWATIIAFSGIETSTSELMSTALIRAKMAESLAPAFNCDANTGFMAGLFSPLDAMLLKPMPELLKTLPMEENIKAALEEFEGELGQLLLFIISYEQGDLAVVPKNISIAELNQTYLTATEWANQL
ncbi:MAG: HDOD domain-containing protein, partial [Psychrosphaera sp.]|nr:HDOD domain-containing protein [Psychrosphaera sp.]